MALFSEEFAFNSIIGAGSSIKGDVKINGFVRIDGDLDGNLETTGNVVVGAHARINGNITAKAVTVGGIIRGNIIAPEAVHAMGTSAIIGDIQTHRLQADMNAVIQGHCISLSDDNLYNEAVSQWQNEQTIASRSVLQSFHLPLDRVPVPGV